MTEFKPLKQVLVRAESNASLRTKNRIREHGPVFLMEKMEAQVGFWANGGILIHSKKTDWIGWLPKNEIFWIIDNDWDYKES